MTPIVLVALVAVPAEVHLSSLTAVLTQPFYLQLMCNAVYTDLLALMKLFPLLQLLRVGSRRVL